VHAAATYLAHLARTLTLREAQLDALPQVDDANGLELFNEELKRRTRVVRIFPNREACLRLVSALCVEQSEEWLAGRVYLDMRKLGAAAARRRRRYT
jgi:transposase-like protein